MTAKEWLSRYKALGLSIKAKEDQLAQLAASATSTTAKINGGMPGASGVSRKIERAVVSADEISSQIHELQREQRAIIDTINACEPRECAVLTYLYVLDLTVEQAAKRLNYCGKQVTRIRDEALAHIRVPVDG